MVSRNLSRLMIPAVLFILLLISAGCTSIPGPEPRATPLVTTTPIPQEVVTVKTMKVTTPLVTTIPPTVAATTAPEKGVTATTTTGQGAYESRTCSRLGGRIVLPGQQCPGTWLIAADTFSCCSAAPIRESTRNTSVTIDPFELVIVMDDDPGRVLP